MMAETTIVSQEKKEMKNSNNKVTDYSLGIFGTSDNFIMAMQMAKALAASTIVPQIYQKNESNCLIAIEQAQRLNISPLMVMQNLYVIQGRPTWSSKFLIAAINNSKKFDMELQFDEASGADGSPYSCTAWTTKGGRRVDGMKVTMDMARAEGWIAKNGSKWKTMPQLMLRYRAASFFSSLNCPELTIGLYTKEEMEDTDLKEYPMEDLMESVKQDIEQNANSVEFSADDIEVEKPANAAKKSNEMPSFMSAE